MRIDKLLWFLRLAKTRSAAQALVGAGHVRLNGKRVERTAQAVAIGDVMVIPLHKGGSGHRIAGPARAARTCTRRTVVLSHA